MHQRIVLSLLCLLGMLLSGETRGLAQTYTIFGNATPKTPVDADTGAVTLGVKFTSAMTGQIVGVRFYRARGSTQGYGVALYSSTGTRLAQTSVARDTCSVPCWEQVNFTTPVAINANTRYVAAYFTPHGGYAGDQGGLLSNVTNAPLTALSDGSSGGDGVYHYGSYIGFPTGSWNASNYYVDVAFTPTTPPQQVISSIGLSTKTVAANQPAGTIVGQASVVMSPTTPAFSGSFATPATDAYFQMSGTALTTKAPLGAGTYNTSIIATQSGITDSPFTQGETITVTAAPTLSVNLNPPSPTIAADAQPGAVVATITASWSDGSPFTGTLTFGMPYSNDNATFAMSGNNLIVNPAGPGVSADAGTTQNVTIVAAQ